MGIAGKGSPTGADKINLVESWLAAELIPGMTVAEAIRQMNEQLGTRYTPQVFYKWRRGNRPIPQPVQDYMLVNCIYKVLSDEGLALMVGDEIMDRIAARLCPPKRY